MSIAYLDTHAAVFLHDGLLEEFSIEAKRQMEANDLFISPAVLLEFDYLFRRKQIAIDAKSLFATIGTSFSVGLCNFPFAKIAHDSLDIGWTMDPFDRLIVAHARANRGSLLITRDRQIRRNYPAAVW
jgi:PIN domain nuclease of toxin-antitoxin system